VLDPGTYENELERTLTDDKVQDWFVTRDWIAAGERFRAKSPRGQAFAMPGGLLGLCRASTPPHEQEPSPCPGNDEIPSAYRVARER
jgi:hypothetical protein